MFVLSEYGVLIIKIIISSTEFLPLIIDKTKINYQYCYYLLTSEKITVYLCRQNTNTSGSHKRIDPLDFLNIDIQLPSIEEQTKIGSLLAYIDDKITLNRAINHNLPTLDRSSRVAGVRRVA